MTNCLIQSAAPNTMRPAKRRRPSRSPCPLRLILWTPEGELNRRLVVLALLYIQRRTNPYAPEVSLIEVERRMGFPRDYLEFTSWYLRNRGYITRADNSDFTLTVEGVDFVESQRVNIPILNKLLTAGSELNPDGVVADRTLPHASSPIIVPPPEPIIKPAGNGASAGPRANEDEKV